MIKKAISLAITGASGAVYGVRLLEQLLLAGETVYLMVSRAAQVVLATEHNEQWPGQASELQTFLQQRFQCREGQLQVFGREQWTAPVASGSAGPRAMVICPCSMGSLGAIANGLSDNLIERAADVMVKEGRRLILVPRETPLSAIHLENMLKLARLGVTILPAAPGFYHQPQGIDDLVDHVVARILDQLGIEQGLVTAWGYGDHGRD